MRKSKAVMKIYDEVIIIFLHIIILSSTSKHFPLDETKVKSDNDVQTPLRSNNCGLF